MVPRATTFLSEAPRRFAPVRFASDMLVPLSLASERSDATVSPVGLPFAVPQFHGGEVGLPEVGTDEHRAAELNTVELEVGDSLVVPQLLHPGRQ